MEKMCSNVRRAAGGKAAVSVARFTTVLPIFACNAKKTYSPRFFRLLLATGALGGLSSWIAMASALFHFAAGRLLNTASYAGELRSPQRAHWMSYANPSYLNLR